MNPLPVYAAEEARWDCHSCGACCRGAEGVAVTAEEAQAIEEHDWAAEGAPVRAGVVIARLDEATGELQRRRPAEARAALEDDLLAAAAADGPLRDLPWRVAHPLKRALGQVPPPYPFEGPPETPFYEALAVASEFLAPQAAAIGARRFAAG